METFFIFLLVGVLAQAVDGALGMAYGVIANTVLLAFGVPPATASASVHVAKIFTGAASGGSHLYHRNVQWSLFWPLTAGGIVGGIVGAYVLTGIEGDIIKPFILAYLLLIGLWVLYRAFGARRPKGFNERYSGPLGVVGGFLDAIGGGGWGPVVTSTLLGAGADPRKAIGTTNAAEFVVTAAISATFFWALATGHWRDAEALTDHAAAIRPPTTSPAIAAAWSVRASASRQ